MTSNTIQALKDLYVANGGSIGDVDNLNVIPDLINRLSNIVAVNELSFEGADPSVDLWGVSSSTFQQYIMPLGKNSIYGLLIHQDNPLWASGTLSGTGYFIALKFNTNIDYHNIKVGLDPSSTNMQPIQLDEDYICVFKLTDPVNYQFTQKIKIIITLDGIEFTRELSLDQLQTRS